MMTWLRRDDGRDPKLILTQVFPGTMHYSIRKLLRTCLLVYHFSVLSKRGLGKGFKVTWQTMVDTAMQELELPSVMSPEFLFLLFTALVSPYIFICGIYCYHFVGRKNGAKLRKVDDRPLSAHINDWHSALFKIEGISAVVIYMFLGLSLSLLFPDALGALVPQSVKTLTCTFHPFLLFLHFFVFDSLMWVIHYTQHHWRWLYYKTHSVHHTITSPTMIVALTG